MLATIETILALLIVAFAVWYVIRRLKREVTNEEGDCDCAGGCGHSCDNCPFAAFEQRCGETENEENEKPIKKEE